TLDDGIANATFFGEQPPILTGGTVDEVATLMLEVIADPLDARGVGEKAVAWVKRHHSADRIAQLQLDAYAALPGVSRLREALGPITDIAAPNIWPTAMAH